MKPNDELAFPQLELTDNLERPGAQHSGMTLRDYFAAVALQGLIADGCLTRTLQGHARPFNESEVADQAYTMADAMLAERQRGAA